MKHISFAKGCYIFDFPKNKTAEQCADWLIELADNLNINEPHYVTSFFISDKEELASYISRDNHSVCVEFDGFGHWDYEENIQEFKNDEKFSSLLSEMDGIEILINYINHQFGNTIAVIRHTLVSYHDNKIEITNFVKNEYISIDRFFGYELEEEEFWRHKLMNIDDYI